MNLDESDIQNLRKAGVKIVTADGKPFISKQKQITKEKDLNAELLIEIEKLLKNNNTRNPIVESKPPVINVQPPEVNITIPKVKHINKWHFKLTKDTEGRTTDIIATAMD